MSFFDPFSRFSWIPMMSRDSPRLTAQIDWIEAPNNHIFKINVPGLSRDEIKVQLEEENVLQISSEGAKEESSPKEAIWHIAGRGKGDFSRQIVLPENVKADQIKAQVENGVLTIVVPKDVSTKYRSRNIPISSKL
eukprot:TRINITY_DN587_c0_g1_i1.p1 TRINITY_DN587_c0_g1~~TRINITY_DN587_c0_g1_i1.p1  ORF type:complete len:136 (+),score=13.08 TRINITY_DN587_c0_g1_i1:334-741(+)